MIVTCDNCGQAWSTHDLQHTFPDIPKLGERIEPGRIVPAGECNDCGALVYPQMAVYAGDDSRDNPCFKSLGNIEQARDENDDIVFVIHPGEDDVILDDDNEEDEDDAG